MNNFLLTVVATLAILGTISAFPPRSGALECGDLNGDCQISAVDALQLLRRAVGLSQQLLCECECEQLCEFPPSPTDPTDCFGDEACIEEDPEKPYCDGFVCSVCAMDEHCEGGEFCDHGLRRCVAQCAYP